MAFGSLFDISLIVPELDSAAVSLSAGYYNAHRLNEYIVRSELEHTIQKVVEIVADSARADFPRYEFYTGDYCEEYFSDDYFYETDDLPDDLPIELHDICEEFLAVYLPEQLEEVRLQYGNRVSQDRLCFQP